MEIKTTEHIHFNKGLVGFEPKKKWVAVEDLKEYINKELDSSRIFYEETNDTQTHGIIIILEQILEKIEKKQGELK